MRWDVGMVQDDILSLEQESSLSYLFGWFRFFFVGVCCKNYESMFLIQNVSALSAPSLNKSSKAFRHDRSPVSVSTSPVIAYKAPFTISNNAFRTHEWSILARDNVLLLRKTPPLVSFLGWWLVGQHFIPAGGIWMPYSLLTYLKTKSVFRPCLILSVNVYLL
jgi:hypothetical protein